MSRFEVAPSSKAVKVLTAIAMAIPFLIFTVLILVIVALQAHQQLRENIGIVLVSIMPPMILFVLVFWLCWRIKPCEYVIENSILVIKRRTPWKDGSYQLSEFDSIDVMTRLPMLMVQMPGTGGVFSYSGKFFSTSLGWFRGYLTTGKTFLFLKSKNNSIAISPAYPEQMLAELVGVSGITSK